MSTVNDIVRLVTISCYFLLTLVMGYMWWTISIALVLMPMFTQCWCNLIYIVHYMVSRGFPVQPYTSFSLMTITRVWIGSVVYFVSSI